MYESRGYICKYLNVQLRLNLDFSIKAIVNHPRNPKRKRSHSRKFTLILKCKMFKKVFDVSFHFLDNL